MNYLIMCKLNTVIRFYLIWRIDKKGEFIREEPLKEKSSLNQGDDEVKEMENGLLLSVSEMIDIAQGADSD